MKMKDLYNLASFESFVDSARQVGFQDSQAGVVLARNLLVVDPTLFQKKYPELAFVNAGLTVSNLGGYARQIQSLRILDKGDFTEGGDVAANKGRIGLTSESSTIEVFPHNGHSIWNDDEVKEADLQGINLPSRYVQTHNRLYLRKIDLIGLTGIGTKTKGLLNTTAFTATGAGGAIETLTAQQMYDAFATLITGQRSAVNNTPEYSCNRVLMPVRVYNKIEATLLNTANASNKTVLQSLKDNFPGVDFGSTFRADNAAGGGNLATSATVAYSNNEQVMQSRIPVPLEIGEIIKPSSFEFRVDSKFRIAGVDILEGTGGKILTGL